MNRTESRIILALVLFVFANPTFSWTLSGIGVVNPLHAKSITTMTAGANESLINLESTAVLAVTGGSSITAQNLCPKTSGVPLTCIASVVEAPPTVGCEYCASGLGEAKIGQQNFEQEWWGPVCKTFFPPTR